MVSPLRRLLRRIRHKRLHRAKIQIKWVELGSDYGGWPVAVEHLPARPVVYSFGVGEDISFDLAIIDRFDAIVHAFDPTPRSQGWLSRQTLPAGFQFHPIGIAGEDGSVEFFPPADGGHVSFSNAPSAAQVADPIVAEVCAIDTIARRLDDMLPDILKMDVEGFEYEVVKSLVRTDIRPTQLLIEFHHGMYKSTDQDTLDAVASLEAIGYRVFFVSDSGREYGLLRAG
jgi:FkbM family methyltransferase